MYLYRKMFHIPGVQRVTNEELLRRIGKRKKRLLTINQRKTSYIGYIMRRVKYEFLRLMIEGKIQGRQTTKFIAERSQKKRRIFRTAVSRIMLAIQIANFRKKTATLEEEYKVEQIKNLSHMIDMVDRATNQLSEMFAKKLQYIPVAPVLWLLLCGKRGMSTTECRAQQ